MERKPNYTAVHAVVYNDAKGKTIEIAPGTGFHPADHNLDAETVASLEARGSIRKIKAAAKTADDTTDTTDTTDKSGKADKTVK
jgi:hypothetical protein